MNAPLDLPVARAALEYAENGWHVFPVPPGQKKSFKSAAHSDGRRWGATDSAEIIRKDWSRWPEANVGISCGPESGIFVVEADTVKGHGVDGVANLLALAAEHDGIPHTLSAVSPSGSLHFYFRYPTDGEVRNSESKVAPGVDVRGAGGMIIGVPSVKPGVDLPYRWLNPPPMFEPVDCPEWLLDLCQKDTAASSEAKAKHRAPFDRATSDEVRELLSYISPDLPYGSWVSVLMAIHDQFGGSMTGRMLAEDWSRRGMKFKAGDVDSRWSGFSSGGVTWATVPAMAAAMGADLAAIARKHRGNQQTPRRQENPVAPRKVEAVNEDADEPQDGDGRTLLGLPDVSHDALALRIGERGWDADAKFVQAQGKWFFWSETHWKQDDRLSHMTRMRAFLREEARALTEGVEDAGAGLRPAQISALRARAVREADQIRSKQTIAAVESLARSNECCVASPEDFDTDLLILGTPSGTVDLRTGELRPGRRQDMVTKQTAVGPAPSGAEPALWLAFLDLVFQGDTEVIAFMQRAAGYALTGKTNEHKLLFLHGGGRNGKSTFINTLSWLWNDYARSAPVQTFLETNTEHHPTDLAGLQGRRLVIASELPKGRTWNETVIKDLTGGDTITARFMRGDFFDYDPQMTLMIYGNHQPSFRGVDRAIRARLVLVPFRHKFTDEVRDIDFCLKLRTEGPAILRWAIDGAVAWSKGGLQVPASISRASREYMDAEDVIGNFLADNVEEAVGSFVSAIDLHAQFDQWCRQQNIVLWTQRALVKEMKARDYEEGRRSDGRGFVNIALK